MNKGKKKYSYINTHNTFIHLFTFDLLAMHCGIKKGGVGEE